MNETINPISFLRMSQAVRDQISLRHDYFEVDENNDDDYVRNDDDQYLNEIMRV